MWSKPATGQRKYEAADKGRRTSRFPGNAKSPNLDIGADASRLRERARYLYQNTPYSKRAVNALGNGIVGTGITPTFRIKDLKDPKQEPKELKVIRALWDAFAATDALDVRKGCDFYGRLTFAGINKLVVKTMERDGECMIMRRRVPLKESPLGIQLQVLEMEYLAEHVNYQQLDGGGWTYNGIEYDKRGKTVAYWLYQRHPSEWYSEPKRVSADDIIHLLDVNFAAQNRGVTSAATTIVTESDLDEYEDALIMGKKVQASFALARVKMDPGAIENAGEKDEYDTDMERIEPGMIYDLYPGEQLTGITPPTAPGAEDYLKSQQRKIASGWEVTYEMMTGDLTNVNFSSGRMGWIEHGRTIEHKQWITLIPQFNNRVMGWVLEQILIVPGGLMTLPAGLVITWTTPRREMLDPVKETEAALMQMRAGEKPWSERVKENGDNPEEVAEAYKRDKALWESMGMKADWSVDLVPSLKGTAPVGGDGEKKNPNP